MVTAPAASRTSLVWLRKSSDSGSFSFSLAAARLAAAWKTGVSEMPKRTYMPTATSTMLSRNGMRQPQRRSLRGHRESGDPGRSAWTAEGRPRFPRSGTARRGPASPWARTRQRTMRRMPTRRLPPGPGRSGAGSGPGGPEADAVPVRKQADMTVAAPMSTMVATRVVLRPTRSPMCPKMMPPSGRATKATPKVAKEAMMAADGPEGREEDLRENQRGCRAVDEEVVVLDGGANESCSDDLAQGTRRRGRVDGSGHCVGSSPGPLRRRGGSGPRT